jgi:hypothetical protein
MNSPVLKQSAEEETVRDERTPLLASSRLEAQRVSDPKRRHNLRAHACTALLVLFSTLLFCVLVLFLLLSGITSGAPALHGSPDQIAAQGVSWELKSVDVAELREDGVEVTVGVDVALNVDQVLGLNARPGPAWWNGLRRKIAHLGARNLDTATIHLSTVSVYSATSQHAFLFDLSTPPLTVPVGDSKRHPLKLIFLVTPTRNATDIISFANQSWKLGTVNAHIHMEAATVQGGTPFIGKWDWRRLVYFRQTNVKSEVSIQSTPTLPFFTLLY